MLRRYGRKATARENMTGILRSLLAVRYGMAPQRLPWGHGRRIARELGVSEGLVYRAWRQTRKGAAK